MSFEWVPPTIASLGIGFVLWITQQKILLNAKCNDEKAQARQKESLFMLKMIRCIGKLTYANSIAIQEGKVNGVMAKAIEDYNCTSELFDDFIEEQTTARLH